VKKQLAQQGGIPLGGTPAEFDSFIQSEKDRWEKIIKAAGIKAE
jgi:tripartite-type tricarboxylate transporter receptor subunit TctC